MSFSNIMMLILGAFGAIIGIGSTRAIIVALFWTIGYKIHRKVKYGIFLFI